MAKIFVAVDRRHPFVSPLTEELFPATVPMTKNAMPKMTATVPIRIHIVSSFYSIEALLAWTVMSQPCDARCAPQGCGEVCGVGDMQSLVVRSVHVHGHCIGGVVEQAQGSSVELVGDL